MALPYDINLAVIRWGGTFGPEMAGFIQADLDYLYANVGPGAGVVSFNTRTGAVTLADTDVTGVGGMLGSNNGSDFTVPATVRANLGLVIGTNVQAFNSVLTTLAGASANGQSLVTAADYSAMRTLLGLGSLALQAAGSVAITGGTIAGVAVSGGTISGAAITTSTYNGLTITASTGTLTVTNAKTVSFTNTLTFSGTDSTVLTFPGITCNIGYLEIPQNSQSAAYGLVLSDSGKHILHPIADNNARTYTIPANASVAYPIGTAITFVNLINTVTIAITSDTMYLGGTGTTGSRTLAAYGIATALKVASTTWIISGTGLT